MAVRYLLINVKVMVYRMILSHDCVCKGSMGVVTLKTDRFNSTEEQSMSNRSLM